MEQLYNGFTLNIPSGAFPLSTDSIVLAHFAKLPKNAAVLDLGSGCGTLGLYLCAKDSGCTVTGVELDDVAHQAALSNIQANGLSSRLKSICADLNDIPRFITPGSFHCCVSNPPYYPDGVASKAFPIARQGCEFSLQDLFRTAAWALRYGGDFFLVHKPEQLAQLCRFASEHNLEPKRICLIRHKSDGPVCLILLQCRKGGKPGLIWEEESLHHPDGSPTDFYRKLYHLQEESL